MNTSAHQATLPCCIEGPPGFVPKAQYALRMLLMPLGFDPRWVPREALQGDGLYYGPRGESLAAGVVGLRQDPAAPAYFAERRPYDARHTGRVTWQGEDWPVLFGDGPAADLVASAFFWLSGWQEHVSRERDVYGRFPHAASLQAALGTTVRPAVDAYREVLAGHLAGAGLPLRRRTWGGHAWAFCPTCDVDYLRKWRPGMVYRELVLYFLRNRRGVPLRARLRRLGQFAQDWGRPGDPFRQALERMQAETLWRGARATYFIKTGSHGPHDVPYAAGGRYLSRHLAALEEAGFEVGLHPSFHAHDHPGYLRTERQRLAALLRRPPVSVRQHYLRYDVAATPRLHEAAGFQIDSTLAFAEHEGFRRATCLPFQLFDVEANRPLGVWEMPLAIMESTLFNRRGLGPADAWAATEEVLRSCRRFGGVAVALWHNTLWDELDFPGWGRHFLETLDYARTEGACMTSLQAALRLWQDA